MGWTEYVSPYLTDLSWVMGDDAVNVNHFVKMKFLPVFKEQLGATLLFSQTIDTVAPMLLALYPAGFLQYLWVRSRTPFELRKKLHPGAFVLGGIGPRFLVGPILFYGVYDTINKSKVEYANHPPLDLAQQRHLLSRVNALGEDRSRGPYYDMATKLTLIVGLILFPLWFKPVSGMWGRCSCGVACAMNLSTVLRSLFGVADIK